MVEFRKEKLARAIFGILYRHDTQRRYPIILFDITRYRNPLFSQATTDAS